MSRAEPLPDAPALAGLLAGEDRRRVFAALVLGARTIDDVVAMSGLDARAVGSAVARLRRGGLVDDALAVRAEAFGEAARAAAQRARARKKSPEDLGATAEQAAVLRHFMDDGHLRAVPTQKAKRRVVLDFVVQRFEPGRVYPERDVNFELGKVHADVAALRRYLVDDGYMERRDGFYWRAGGTFDVE